MVVYFILLSSKNSTIPLIAQTIPAVNIPSKKIDGIQWIFNDVVNPPRVIDMKKPTHVDVHNMHEIKSPKNFEFRLIHSLDFSKMEP